MNRISFLALILSGCAISSSQNHGVSSTSVSQAAAPPPAATHTTTASIYSDELEGKKTASGEPFKQEKKTAASKHLPLGSKAEVRNLKTGKKTQVTITDRGPFVKGRGIDLSKSAAESIGMDEEKGVAKVEVRPLPK